MSKFPNHETCIQFLEQSRWRNEVYCPYCGYPHSRKTRYSQRRHCGNCNTKFSVTVGTIFEDTKIPLNKWFWAIAFILDAPKGLSSRQLGRHIRVNFKTAWYLQMRIRRALLEENEILLFIINQLTESSIRKHKTNKLKTWAHQVKKENLSTVDISGPPVSNGTGKGRRHRVCGKPNSILSLDNSESNVLYRTTALRCSVKKVVAAHPHLQLAIKNYRFNLSRSLIGQYHRLDTRYLKYYISEFSYKSRAKSVKDPFVSLLNIGVNYTSV